MNLDNGYAIREQVGGHIVSHKTIFVDLLFDEFEDE